MLPDTKKLLHCGINFLFTPPPVLEQKQLLNFQTTLTDYGLVFQRTESVTNEFRMITSEGSPLEIRVILPGPQVGQLLILSANPNVSLEAFILNVEEVVRAYRRVWGNTSQVLSRDVTIRHLYDSEGDHAFQFLWERRLRQQEGDLKIFGRPVLGGGLRLVMPPHEDKEDRTQVEVKIESFLRDSRMVFIETQFTWPYPINPDEGFKPRNLITAVDNFATKQVVGFVIHSPAKK